MSRGHSLAGMLMMKMLRTTTDEILRLNLKGKAINQQVIQIPICYQIYACHLKREMKHV